MPAVALHRHAHLVGTQIGVDRVHMQHPAPFASRRTCSRPRFDMGLIPAVPSGSCRQGAGKCAAKRYASREVDRMIAVQQRCNASRNGMTDKASEQHMHAAM